MDIQNELGSRDIGGSSTVSAASGAQQAEPRKTDTVAGKAGEKARETAAKAREQAKHAASQAADKAQEAAERAREKGQRFFQQQQSGWSDRISHYSHTAHSVAEKFREEDDPTLARYTDSLADQLDRMSGYLRSRDLQGLFEDVQGAVRRRPEIFFGGMFVAGMAISRFLKATSAPRGRDREQREGLETWGGEDPGVSRTQGRSEQWRSELSGTGPIGTSSGGFGESPLNPGAATPASGPELTSLGSGTPLPAGVTDPGVAGSPTAAGIENNPVTETVPEKAKTDETSPSKCDVPGDRPSSS